MRDPSSLTPREREVLDHILCGETARETAAKLGVAHRTIETHRLRIVQKFCASHVSDVVRMILCPDGCPESVIATFAGLTSREQDVLREAVAGRRTKTSGRRLQLSSRTIEAHRYSLRRKLGARNVVDLIRIVAASAAAGMLSNPLAEPLQLHAM
jgi:DNA-binding CsgD family transcriptional regulator